MWIKPTTPYAFLSAHIYIIGQVLSLKVNCPFSYVSRERSDKCYKTKVQSLIVELNEKAGKMLIKLQQPRMGKSKIHNT